jgi:hypothetical protein
MLDSWYNAFMNNRFSPKQRLLSKFEEKEKMFLRKSYCYILAQDQQHDAANPYQDTGVLNGSHTVCSSCSSEAVLYPLP